MRSLVLAYVILSAADTATTALGLACGASECNPIVAAAVALAGTWGLVGAKTAYAAAMVALLFPWLGWRYGRFGIGLAGCAVGVLALTVTNNLGVLLAL